MSKHPTLPHAPILEALLDFRVEPNPATTAGQLKTMQEALGPDLFPHVQPQKTMSATVQLTAEPEASFKQDDLGFVLRSADQLHVVQAQLGGFTFSRLRPYTTWEDLIAGAREAWAKYVQIAAPRRVIRVAVRTINRIEIPLPSGDLRDWLVTVPDIPRTLPQSISEMFFRVVVPAPATDGAMVILTQAIEPAPLGATHFGAILDIDVYREAEFPLDDGLWRALDPLRALKNDFFFECVTARTLELFK